MQTDFNAQETRPDRKIHVPDQTTSFEPLRWQRTGTDQTASTYAYALDLPEIAECMPGSLRCIMDVQIPDKDHSIEGLQARLLQDGLYPIMEGCLPPDNSHAIAVRFGQKVHGEMPGILILRRDENGLWSHGDKINRKNCGGLPGPHSIDFNGESIACPEKAYLGAYEQFAGYFSVPYGGLEYVPRIECPEFKNWDLDLRAEKLPAMEIS